MKRILVPISFSITSKKALSNAYSIAKEFGATLFLLHCYSKKEYNRIYDFGAEDYDKGIRGMLLNFYNEYKDSRSNIKFNLITSQRTVLEFISKSSIKYDLMVLCREIGSISASNKYLSDKLYNISTNSLCPVLITSTNHKHFSFQKDKAIWHIKRSENEIGLVTESLSILGIDYNIVVSKSLTQEKFTSSFWKKLITFTKKHESSLLEEISQSFGKEDIGIFVIVNHLKGKFGLFMRDDCFQIISQFDIPVLILPSKPSDT